MGTGTVDENWAKQHHSLWLEEEKAKTGATPAPGRMQPAE
jgi:formate dehydrogenase subunit gamma